VVGYMLRWFTCPQTVTDPTTNRARRRVTSLIASNALTTTPVPSILILFDCGLGVGVNIEHVTINSSSNSMSLKV